MADLKWYTEGREDYGSKAAGLEPCKLKQCKGPPGAFEALHKWGPAHTPSAKPVPQVLSPYNSPDSGLRSAFQRRIISNLPSRWVGETEAQKEKTIYELSAGHCQSRGMQWQLAKGRIRPDFQPVLTRFLNGSLWRLLGLFFKHPFSFAHWRANLFQ